MTVPYAFGSATTSIPLSELDANFNTPITIGNTAVQLGNTVTTLNNMTLANATVSSGNVTVTSASLSGNLTFTGTGNRITGDFSNATIANRVMFQTSTTNGATRLHAIPNGTGVVSAIAAINNSDPNNASFMQVSVNATEAQLISTLAGTGTYLPMTFYTGGSERMRVDTSGNVGIGTASPAVNLNVAKASDGIAARFQRSSGGGLVDIETYNGIGGIGTSDNIPFRLNTNNTERMRIDTSGRVGIGTASPGAKLDVRGSSTFLVNATNPTAWVSVDSALTTGSMYNQWNTTSNVGISGTYTNHPYTFVTNNTERMRISATGNVGIGTSSPGNSLQVSRAGADVARFTNTQSNGGDWQFKIGGGGFEDRKLMITDRFSGADNVRVAVDSSGNVGIGTSSPSYLLDVQRTAANGTGVLDVLRLRSTADSAGDGPRLLMTCGNSTTGGAGIGAGGVALNSANLLFYAGGNTERARIDSSGNLLVGTTSTFGNGKQAIQFDGAAANGLNLKTTYATTGSVYVGFYNSAGNTAGFIQQNGTTTVSYATTSDYRLKENVQPMTGALAKVSALKPCTYIWKEDGSAGEGFIAHELQEVVPECVSGEKDAVNEDGTIKPQGIDTSFLVATLVAAMKEQQQMIETLQAEVAALKGA
jgi:hypothetical protein